MNGCVPTDEHMRACECRVVALSYTGPRLRALVRRPSLWKPSGASRSGSQHLLTATPQGTGRRGFRQTPGARGVTATECRMRHAQHSNRSFGGAHDATCRQSGVAAPELCRAPECARA